MRTVHKHWWLSGGASYNPYVTAYVNRIIALGYTMPDATRLSALNTLTTSLSDILPKCDIFYVFALNNALLEEAATLNLVNPSTHQAAPTLSPTYGAKGFMPDGATSYVDTNYNPQVSGVNFQLNNASRFFYIETMPSLGILFEGIASISQRSSTRGDSSANQRINSTNTLNAAVNLSGLGYTAIDRQTLTNVSLYKGLTKTDRTQTSTDVTSDNQLLGRSGTFYSDTEFGLYGMGASLTQAEHALIRSSYLTYRTEIGL